MTDGLARSGSRDRARRRLVIGSLAALVVVAALLELSMGPVTIAPSQVFAALANRLHLPFGAEPDTRSLAVVWDIRMPRVLVAILGGGALGVGGAALQGLYRNPIADPHLLGIGPGAALGAALGALTGSVRGAIAGGVVAGVVTALIVRRLGRSRSGEPSRFILTGLALGAAITAWVGFVVFVGDRTRVPPVEFWLLGNLSAATWQTVGTLVLTAGTITLALLAAARTLDVFALGEADARRLGVDIDMATVLVLMGIGIVTGATVGAMGVVVFVGLISPHVVRRLAGASHRGVLPGSALAGAVLLLLADLTSRVVVSPNEIPVGLVTAAVGGPLFLWLIRRSELPAR